MEAVLQSFFTGLPILLLHVGITVGMLALGIAIYVRVTPYHEINLVRAGNNAAAISLSGAVIGLALPLAVCMAGSVNAYDIIVWGVVALLIQLIVFRVIDLILKEMRRRIEDGEIAAATVLASVKIAVAIINAAAVAG